jgi:hypothetical protein
MMKFELFDISKLPRVKELIITNANQQIEQQADVILRNLKLHSPYGRGSLMTLGILTYSITEKLLSFMREVV